MSIGKKKILILTITTVIIVIISIGAATYTWFTQQAATDEAHKFPATGYEILMFEAEVSDIRKEGKLYPAKIKDEYLINGFELDTYEVFPIGDWPDYLEDEAGIVLFENDLSFWGSIGFGENIYKPIRINYDISIKQDEDETKSTRRLNETNEAAARIEFLEHDNQIHVADQQYVLVNGQFLKEGAVIIKNANDYNVFDRALDDWYFRVRSNYESFVFGDYAHSMFVEDDELKYSCTVPYDEIELPTGDIISFRHPTSGKMILFNYDKFIVYKENDDVFFETIERSNSLEGVNYDFVKVVNPNNNLNISYGNQEDSDVISSIENVLIGESDIPNIVIYSRDGSLFIDKKSDYTPKLAGEDSPADIIYFIDGSILSVPRNPPKTFPYGLPASDPLDLDIYLHGDDLFIENAVTILQKNVFYTTTETPPEGVTSMVKHKFFNVNNFELDDETLVYCVRDSSVGESQYPKVKMIDNYKVKKDVVSYIRDGKIFHTYLPKYKFTGNDFIIQINYRSSEVLDGEMVVEGSYVPDLDRGMLGRILFGHDVVVYKRGLTPIRYIDKAKYYDESELNKVSFINGGFVEQIDTISGLKYDYGRYLLETVTLSEDNIVVLRDDNFRVFTHYTQQENDIELFYYIPDTESWYINEAFAEYLKIDDEGNYYIENVSLHTNDYAYKDTNTGLNYVSTIEDETRPSVNEQVKPIVWNKRLVMSRDTTFLLSIRLYLTTFAHETSADLNGESLNFYIVASFEEWETIEEE